MRAASHFMSSEGDTARFLVSVWVVEMMQWRDFESLMHY